MPAATKKRPPMEAEPGEGKAHEMKESPEEEVREGSESEESDKSSPRGRKRTARGAKRTKAPMDSECGCGGKKGAACDGNCGSKMKRSDALSVLEYLQACELGIQDQSRPYIKARLNTKERKDSKPSSAKKGPMRTYDTIPFIPSTSNKSPSTQQKAKPKHDSPFAVGFSFDTSQMEGVSWF